MRKQLNVSCQRPLASDGIDMWHPLKRSTLLAPSLGFALAACLGSEHPDTTRYEYLYMNGQFVAPYTDFPEGRDREKWQCYDADTKRAFDCTFVHGGWDRYKYVFRKRG